MPKVSPPTLLGADPGPWGIVDVITGLGEKEMAMGMAKVGGLAWQKSGASGKP